MAEPASGPTLAAPAHAHALRPGELRLLHEAPGLLLVDVVSHHPSPETRAHDLTVNLRCSWSGWTATRSASGCALTALVAALDAVPFRTVALDFSGVHEALDASVLNWASERNVLVFAHGTPTPLIAVPPELGSGTRAAGGSAALESVNRRWSLVNDKANFFVPLRRTSGWTIDVAGRRRPVRDAPRTPFTRVLGSGVLRPDQAEELRARRDELDPADTIRELRPGQRVDAWSRAIRR